jgi:hypothetical protein
MARASSSLTRLASVAGPLWQVLHRSPELSAAQGISSGVLTAARHLAVHANWLAHGLNRGISLCAGSPDGAEGLSVDRAFRAIRRADVVGLVIDAVDGVTQQDFRCTFMQPLCPLLPVCGDFGRAASAGFGVIPDQSVHIMLQQVGLCALRRLAERVAEEGRACVLIVNKWDAVEDKAGNLLLCQ